MMRIAAAVLALAGSPALAGEADVLDATARQADDGSWTFSATVAHADTGWDHYADAWRVVGPDGTVLGNRVLVHPHVDEQPFTRSLSGVTIPADIAEVTIEAHDSVHAWGGAIFTLSLE